MKRQKSGRKSKTVMVLQEPKVTLDEGVSHTPDYNQAQSYQSFQFPKP